MGTLDREPERLTVAPLRFVVESQNADALMPADALVDVAMREVPPPRRGTIDHRGSASGEGWKVDVRAPDRVTCLRMLRAAVHAADPRPETLAELDAVLAEFPS